MKLPKEIEDTQGRKISFTRERWSHIAAGHGELVGFREEVVETVKNPSDLLPESDRSDTVHYYREIGDVDELPHNYMCVVVNVEDEFIVTAYPTNHKTA